ncbi:GNAT family N-acetyltransferase [uncultured Serinicoccus sp.]|uniref:GNAT family N-acetyltransferase n=1 Tax=uncultured Serinicoccus sp. TaxID=735514 RepID=UPI002623B745|nr:GNAT family N-acetyltransferase [uncultured Serinicoccus sp.]
MTGAAWSASGDGRVRPATGADLAALSALFLQLYDAELPGMLGGEEPARVEAVRRLLGAAPPTGRYVLEHGGEVVGSGSLATQEAPRPATPPSRLLALPSVLGVPAALASYPGVLRAVLTVAPPPRTEEAQIHSVVVDRRHRGAGAGAEIMGHFEAAAAQLGKQRVSLQVLESNGGALAFYEALGYARVGPAHTRVRGALAFRSVLLCKDLSPPALPGPCASGQEGPPPS